MSSGGSSGSGGRAVLDRVETCPACGERNPDPDRGTFCPACGALLSPRSRGLRRAGLGALLGGGASVLLGLLALILSGARGDGPSPTILTVGLFLLGAAVALGGAGVLRRVARDAAQRESPAARKFLDATDAALIGLLTLFVLSSAALAYLAFVHPTTIRPGIEAAFEGRLAPFLEPPAEDNLNPAAAPPPLAPKLLVLDREANLTGIPSVRPGRPATMHFLLTPSLRAARPEEVGTIVWLDWRANRVSIYSSGKQAYEVACEVTVLDAANRRVLARRTFDGGPPPPQVPRGEDGFGALPEAEIAAWLSELAGAR